MDFLEQSLHLLSNLPIRVRRTVLRSCFVLASLAGRIERDALVQRRIASTLHLPRGLAARVANRATFHDLMFALEWLALKNRSRAQLLADAQAVRVDGEEILQWAGLQKAVILASLHMGSYPTSLAKILYTHFQGRRIVIVRSKAIPPDERTALEKLNHLGFEVEHLFFENPETFLDLVRFVKRGAILVTLVDLPSSYGRSSDVELLWYPARIAVGVIDLSHLCRAPIVMFRTDSSIFGDVIEIQTVLQPAATTAKARQEAADKIACFITSAVIDTPEQWHMWDRLPDYAASECFA